MSPPRCSRCPSPSSLLRSRSLLPFCRHCFVAAFEAETLRALLGDPSGTPKPGQGVAVAASGGKDSTVLAHVLSRLDRCHNLGLRLALLAVDEGISGYREPSLVALREVALALPLPLLVVEHRELFGLTVDQAGPALGGRSRCTLCGVLRRRAMERGAGEMGADWIVTGHNADDVAETVLMNFLRGDVARLRRAANEATGATNEFSRATNEAIGANEATGATNEATGANEATTATSEATGATNKATEADEASGTTKKEPNRNPTEPNDNSSEPNGNSMEPNDNSSELNGNPTEPNDNSSEPNGNSLEPNDNSMEPNDNSSELNDNSSEPNRNPTKLNRNPVGPNDNPTEPNHDSSEPNRNPTKFDRNSMQPNDNSSELKGNLRNSNGNPTKFNRNPRKPTQTPSRPNATPPVVPRLKPLRHAAQREIVLYAHFLGLSYASSECHHAPLAFRGHPRALLKDLEAARPAAVAALAHSGRRLALGAAPGTGEPPGACGRCGSVASGDLCMACALLAALDKGRPRLALGKRGVRVATGADGRWEGEGGERGGHWDGSGGHGVEGTGNGGGGRQEGGGGQGATSCEGGGCGGSSGGHGGCGCRAGGPGAGGQAGGHRGNSGGHGGSFGGHGACGHGAAFGGHGAGSGGPLGREVQVEVVSRGGHSERRCLRGFGHVRGGGIIGGGWGGGPRGQFGGPWGSFRGPRGSFGGPWVSFGGPRGSFGGPWGQFGGPGVTLGDTGGEILGPWGQFGGPGFLLGGVSMQMRIYF
ncbi:cytoplasmic tRNA 2-thiolation protein 1 [Corapipo altera]|uniref:cytoplasmic tRNA 2-thiolation protein 1 n=1 Tax=Corapipo altera TaxID=415028 RepID=UPI000FD69BD8|nr:cytoplasmic tRNA 2-thiolation protein 1 [Corapipo altera]